MTAMVPPVVSVEANGAIGRVKRVSVAMLKGMFGMGGGVIEVVVCKR